MLDPNFDEARSNPLLETAVLANPIQQFKQWYGDIQAKNLLDPDVMTLATVGKDGKPSARMVLLKGVDERGFQFYTNYDSRKGKQLQANPWTALVFYWAPLHRQVRIEGKASRVTAANSDRYFASRPRGSQLSAAASPQSRTIPSRAWLEAEKETLVQRYEGQSVPRPGHWGGYRVSPTRIEFWQGRPDRLHDRLCYRRQENGRWQIERLAP